MGGEDRDPCPQRGSTTNVEANVTATTATADQVPSTSQSKTRQRPIGQGSRSSGHSGSRSTREGLKKGNLEAKLTVVITVSNFQSGGHT